MASLISDDIDRYLMLAGRIALYVTCDLVPEWQLMFSLKG